MRFRFANQLWPHHFGLAKLAHKHLLPVAQAIGVVACASIGSSSLSLNFTLRFSFSFALALNEPPVRFCVSPAWAVQPPLGGALETESERVAQLVVAASGDTKTRAEHSTGLFMSHLDCRPTGQADESECANIHYPECLWSNRMSISFCGYFCKFCSSICHNRCCCCCETNATSPSGAMSCARQAGRSIAQPLGFGLLETGCQLESNDAA